MTPPASFWIKHMRELERMAKYWREIYEAQARFEPGVYAAWERGPGMGMIAIWEEDAARIRRALAENGYTPPRNGGTLGPSPALSAEVIDFSQWRKPSRKAG